MDLRGNDRVLKVIRILIALVAEIEPSLRVLVDEERRKRSNVAKAVKFEGNAFPSIPSIGLQGWE